jgi:hypothetical protein
MAVRPEGKRRINLPSEVIPVTRLRTEWVRPRVVSATELRLGGACLADEAIDFFLFSAADRLAVAGGGSVFASTDEFVAVSVETELSGVAAAAFSAGLVGAVSWD